MDNEDYIDDFNDFIGDFDKDDHARMINMISFLEMTRICQWHIDNDNEPYTEDEFERIIAWVQETRLNETLLGLLLKGKIDVIFDEEKLKESHKAAGLSDEDYDGLGEDLLFTMTKWTRDELEMSDDPTESVDREKLSGLMDVDFEDND